MGRPSGTVTFLFTDIEDSTRLWEAAPEEMRAALERHDLIVRQAIESHGGYVFSTGGDGFAAAFSRAREAVAAALEAQTAVAAEPWLEAASIRVRMALHTGEVTERGSDYFGTPVNQTARLMALGHGGQVLCSAVTAALVGEATTLVDLSEHRLKDLSAPQRVFQVGESRFPPLRSVDAVPGNLPTMLTDLVGRAEDIAELVALVERERLVTLTGPGGVGKTSMALAVAGASTASFPDGCWFAELAAASTGDEVVRAVSAAMGAPATDLAGLARFLSDRRVLIVVDNCEHVLSDAARLAEKVLGTGPDMVMIATSREPLGVRGEVVRGVRSLSVPDRDANTEEAINASAVSLFVARATSASDRFVLDERNVDAVVEICRQLDGIPLAIELAAARVRGMGPAEIARRLSERFRLLTASGGALERHRTLQGAVSWSHDLLTENERRVFRRLAVFPASFDLAAAEAVAGADEPVDVVDCALRLVDRSLVVYDQAVERYRLLETLRQYASDRLADAAETDLCRDRHAEFFAALATQSALYAGEWPSDEAFHRIGVEMDNLRAAVGWFERQGQWGDLLRLYRGVHLLVTNSAPTEGHAWYCEALAHLPDLDVQERIYALGELSSMWLVSGAPGDERPADESIALADATGLIHSPQAWMTRSVLLNNRGDHRSAQAAAERAVAVAEERGDKMAWLISLGILACVVASVGDYARSAELAAATLRLGRSLGTFEAMAVAVNTAAGSYLTNRPLPDFAGGMGILEANPVELDSVSWGQAAWIHRMWGLANLGLKRSDAAIRHLIASYRLVDRVGQQGMRGEAVLALAVALLDAQRPALASQLLAYSEAHFPPQPVIQDLSHTWFLERLARIDGALSAAEKETAAETGARLDRRGFMRLLAEAQQLAESLPAAQ